MTERTIPLLPCQAVQPIVDFYTALGFETTFLQKSPYPYVVVERGAVELQFFGMKDLDPAGAFSACYVVTDEVDALHEAFRAGLREAYGRIPLRGLPRIGPLKDMTYGMRQFLLTDPSGNSIRVGQHLSGDGRFPPAPKDTFARALHFALSFADSKEDPAAAIKILDRVLGLRNEKPTAPQLLRLLALRGDLAFRLDEREEATRLLQQAADIPLNADEREEVRDDLCRLADLRESLGAH